VLEELTELGIASTRATWARGGAWRAVLGVRGVGIESSITPTSRFATTEDVSRIR